MYTFQKATYYDTMMFYSLCDELQRWLLTSKGIEHFNNLLTIVIPNPDLFNFCSSSKIQMTFLM